ncbi:MAG: diaminopimelate epimerase [Acidimicrobiia bacterium]|nr:diaminopimelate epimerase [Acidimicrobiia bacterium]
MQGLGNDFIVVDDVEMTSDLVRDLCDRRFGVGADGVLRVTEGPTMEYWNADGGAAEMCGNGLRCVALYARDRGMVSGEAFLIGTPVGDRGAVIVPDAVTVELGQVSVGESVVFLDRDWVLVDVGNPHAVTWVDDLDQIDVAGVGSRMQEEFPNGVNVEFVTIDSSSRLNMRVWERGVGETLACGTGIVAAAAASIRHYGAASEVEVVVPGGTAGVSLVDGVAHLSGPAEYVFEGVWNPLGPHGG